MAFLNSARITATMPCIAMPERIRFIAELDQDVTEMMPYINAVMDNAVYNHAGLTLTIKKNEKMIGVHGRQFAGGKVIDLADATALIEWFKGIVNDCYERKDTIQPNFDRRRSLTILDILKLLPLTNCQKCGEPTCTAFAAKLAAEDKDIIVCTEIFSGNYNDKRDILLNLLRSCGYSIPTPFVKLP
jgi:ArsR family metal-binding transcriptional regulator